MTIKSSGSSLSFSEIATEFGTPPNKNLGAYRVSQNIGSLSSLPLDDGIPQSGQIKFSDFYGRRLNNVVDCHSSGGSIINAKSRYNNNNVTVVGGFRSKKDSNSKIIINVNATFISSKSSVSKCALRTGSYGSNVILRVDVGSSGQIFGAGGDGGDGSNGPGSGSSGGTGTSGLGIDQESEGGASVVINNSGLISAGFGGGGGGGGAYDYDKNSSRRASGGGGGGGAGNPVGEGGNGGEEGSDGSNGGDGGSNSAGAGGGGGNSGGEAVGGEGGGGGKDGEGADSGGSGSGGEGSGGSGGGAGGNGAAIRRSSGVSISVVNNGTIRGSTSASGVS
jgi:hypothetical protein